jgi:HSP20 family protein
MATREVKVRDNGRVHDGRLYPFSRVREGQDGDIVLELEMPGVSKEDLEIVAENNELRIRGKRSEQPPRGEYLLRERARGSYYRAFTLDPTIDPARIEAAMDDGVLTVTLHRRESVKPRKIAIR